MAFSRLVFTVPGYFLRENVFTSRCVHILTNRESIFFSRNQVQLKALNQFVSDSFEILQMTSDCMDLYVIKIWKLVSL